MKLSHPGQSATMRLPPTVAAAHRRLFLAVTDAALRGQPPPCVADPGPWVDGDPTTRQTAAARCAHCPVLDACATYAEAAREGHHVWAGRDRTTHTRSQLKEIP